MGRDLAGKVCALEILPSQKAPRDLYSQGATKGKPSGLHWLDMEADVAHKAPERGCLPYILVLESGPVQG